ncbi:hypothetical protein AB1Y20_004794 [Prymnesium parvum]|uniref:ATP receptor n=1 Tax=Prymnesium parvum TaxID=97485 RepID=A0AB34J0A5_PRYPA
MISALRRRITAIDLDELFSYSTSKEVRMLDRRLGIVCWLIRILVVVYVAVYVFLICEGYTSTEKGVGFVISQVEGTTYSRSNGVARPWDSIDAVQPALEDGAAFVTTTAYYTPLQRVGNCSTWSKQCSTGSDCSNTPPLSTGSCNSGYCTELQWCPAYSDESVTSTQLHQLQGADRLRIWVKAAIMFPSLDSSRVFSTIDEEKPNVYTGSEPSTSTSTTSGATSGTTVGDGSARPPDQFTIGELLSLAGTSYETVQSTGCVISVSLLWNCFVDGGTCQPTIQVQRLDLSTKRNGFSYQYANYYRTSETGEQQRDLYTVKGVRMLLSSRGVGKKISLSAIMLQVSSLIALLWLANMAADFLMLHVLPERKHYRTYKQERTPDFSDLRNKIAEVEGEKKKLRERKNRFASKYFES